MPALEATSLPDGAGFEMGWECHPASAFLTVWSSGENKDYALPALRV